MLCPLSCESCPVSAEKMATSMEGKVCVVTGASSGIGEAIARALHAQRKAISWSKLIPIQKHEFFWYPIGNFLFV